MWNDAQLPEFKVFSSRTRERRIEKRRRRRRRERRRKKQIWGRGEGRKTDDSCM